MTSYVENETDIVFEFDAEKLINQLMEKVLDTEGCPYEAQVNVLFTDNDGILLFNKEHRGIDAATDVLSFPMIAFEKEADFSVVEEDDFTYFEPDSGELMLGDIILSLEKVIAQAENFGHSIRREFAFLVTHSLLHLCGYDHMTPDEAKVMESKQEAVLKELGITRDC
ncbi:MAG: rRNA maturation RNase YbeY [Lachnospiraceae bacterium]|nr:rRNA maturation RNase YbeY [Lachnospiraceae bacterium]